MIPPSNDQAAGQCIRALGYAYLNAVLMKAGFFVPGRMRGDERGIWIGGDYEGSAQQRINAVNDGTGAVVTTTAAMCRLVALIETGDLVNDTASGGTSNQEMKNLLAEAALGVPPAPPIDTPIITTAAPRTKAFADEPFTLVRGKLGFAGLGRGESGPKVDSECSVLAWKTDAAADPSGDIKKALADRKLTGTLVICFQNVVHNDVTDFQVFADVVNQSYGALLAAPP